MESPKATTVPEWEEDRTLIAFSQNIDVVVDVNRLRPSSAATSPEPGALEYDVTKARLCWLGLTSMSGMQIVTLPPELVVGAGIAGTRRLIGVASVGHGRGGLFEFLVGQDRLVLEFVGAPERRGRGV